MPASTTLRSIIERPLTPYFLVLGASSLLIVLGLVMVFSASSVTSFMDTGSSFTIAQKQALWVGIGLPPMFVGSRLPVRVYRALAIPALLAAVVLLVLVLVPGIGVNVNGNQNWIDVGGPFRLQPSEAAKIALVLWVADLLARKQKLLVQWKHLIVPLLPVAVLVIGLVLLGGDLGTSLILMSIVGGLLFVVGAPLRLFVLLGLGAGSVIAFMAFERSARLARFQHWFNPYGDYLNGGWQATHGLFALASGGWWGVGLGASREKWGALPEAHTDFIFAVIGEELGLAGTLAVLALFGALMFGAIRIALVTRDPFVRYASAGIVVWLGAQTVVNIGGVVNLLPITGVPLPLVSYGGSALLPTMLAVGMLLSFARRLPGAESALSERGPGPIRRRLTRAQ